MRIALISCIWKRHALTPIWWRGTRRLIQRFAEHGLTVSVTVAGSEPRHRRLAERHGATWVEAANAPLGAKWNAAAQSAYRSGADYLLIMGSDDFLSDPLIDQYAAALHAGWRYLGLSGIYFFEPRTGRLAIFSATGARYGAPLGAGRMVHQSLLPDTGRPWLDCRNRGLDHDMQSRCELPPAKLFAVTPEAPAVDVKTETNLWTFDKLTVAYPPSHPCTGPLNLPEWSLLARLGTPVADRSAGVFT